MDNFTTNFTKCLSESDGNIEIALKKLLNSFLEKEINNLLQVEMTQLIGFEKNQDKGTGAENVRNGSYTKPYQTSVGEITITVPRDRNGKFSSPIIPKYKRRSEEISDIIVKLYQSNMTTDQIRLIVESLYNKQYSKMTVSRITDSIIENVNEFKNSQLEDKWFALYLDATYVPIRRDSVKKEAILLAIGINFEGEVKILGYDIVPQESADGYQSLLNSLKERGMQSIEIVVSDDLPGIDGAIDKTFPDSERQRCYLHVLRSIIKRVRPSQKREISQEFMDISRCENKEKALIKLDDFVNKRSKSYPFLKKIKDKSIYFLAFYKYPIELRKLIYSNNRIESYNKQIKRQLKIREQFVTTDALEKLLVSMFIQSNEGGFRKVNNWEKIKELKFEK